MKLKLLSITLLICLFNAACTKDDDPAPDPAYPVAGLWIGTYTVTQQPNLQPLPYSFVFNPNGTLITAGKGDNGQTYYSEGTWTLTDSVVTANYETINYPGYTVTQSATLTYHNNGTMTSATWTDVVNPAGHLSGNFQNLKRIN